MKHIDSLRRKLLKRLLWPLTIILLLGAGFSYYFAIRAAVNTYDLGLLDAALDISRLVNLEHGKLSLNLPPVASQMLQISNDDRVSFAAWSAEGELFAGNPKLLIRDALEFDENHIFEDINLNGEENRITVLRSELNKHTYYIAVAETLRGRNRLTRGIFISMLLPEALLALVSVLAVMFGVRRGLTPIEQLRDEIASRTSSDLKPIDESTAPAELAPIIHGINELLDNLASSFASHRRFIADAAHQLRTPLAALSSQLEVALEKPAENNKAMLQNLLHTTQRTTHLANQLLSLARLEHSEQSMYDSSRIDLQQLISDTAADFVTLGARKQVELEFDLQPASINGNPLLMRELIANLLDNAVRYTPRNGMVRVSLEESGNTVFLHVEDNGPGVPEAELEKLGTPFHRLPSDHAEGCGLGLAIVREIARLHQARIYFEKGEILPGLRINLVFTAA